MDTKQEDDKPIVALIAPRDHYNARVFLAQTPPEFKVEVLPPDLSQDEIVERGRQAQFLVLIGTRPSEQLLREAKRLRLIHVDGQGYDRIPLQLTRELGIPVANASGLNGPAVAEHTVLLMLAVLRHLPSSMDSVRRGNWSSHLDRGSFQRIGGMTVGLVGFGGIGRRVARLVRGFEAEVVFYDKADIPQAVADEVQARRLPLEELLKISDIVSLHVMLTESSRGMIGWPQLAMMKPSAILINTSRGQVVDEAALIRALKEKKIAGAGLDVFDKEPPETGNPLLHMDNVVVTPHMGGASGGDIPVRAKFVWQNITRVWEGKAPVSVVNAVTGQLNDKNPR